MKVFSRMLYLISLFLISTYCFSQTPIQRWEFTRGGFKVDDKFLHAYNIGVARGGFTFTSIDHPEKYPYLLVVDENGEYLYGFYFPKPPIADAIYKLKIEADNIYLNSVEDTFYDFFCFGIQTTISDSANKIFFPKNLSISRVLTQLWGNQFQGFNETKNEYFHSSINSQLKFDIRFIARSEFSSIGDSVYTVVKVGQINQVGVLTRTIDSFLLSASHKDEFETMPKPKAMRWQPKYGQWPQYHDGRFQEQNSGQLGMMISADTLIPTSKTVTQVRTAQFVGVNGLEKFDQVVDVNPYLVENFAGKRLRWKGFTNSSFGFVALYENIDDNNRNILIRYNTATQTFTTVPLDPSVDCRSLCIDSIGALAIVGTKNNAGNNDFYLGFFNSLGELSEQSWGGDEYDRLNDCVIDSLGEIAVSGQKGNDLYLAKFTFNATSVSDKGTNSVPSIFIHQGGSSTANNELVVDNLASGNTRIRMYTMQGTFVGTIYEGMIQEGATYRFPLPSSSISNGVYLIVLENNGITQTKQFVVMK
ncbi:MAG: T9SS type A sorting domain-containing protein [Candidatus Kapabacteria bacterium]|nr:T9SS type A sorting domain-containing protein [Candidatus Kapabacteria bacterium]